MKKAVALILVFLSVALCGCNSLRPVTDTELGFVLDETKTEYILTNPFALKPISLGEAYCKADEMIYYQIDFEDPSDFLSDLDPVSGSSFVFRNQKEPDITVASFDAIAAWIYLEGKSPVMVGQLYPDNEYLPEEKQGLNGTQDTALVRQMVKALTDDEPVTVPDSEYTDADTYYFRLLSQKYPGLYYLVCFFGDTSGNYYLEDMGTFTIVKCPTEIKERMVGE